MTVLYGQKTHRHYKGPAFGGSRDGALIVSGYPSIRFPIMCSVEMSGWDVAEINSAGAVDVAPVETYHYSQHGFWYEETLGEQAASELFHVGEDIEAWADDDA